MHNMVECLALNMEIFNIGGLKVADLKISLYVRVRIKIIS